MLVPRWEDILYNASHTFFHRGPSGFRICFGMGLSIKNNVWRCSCGILCWQPPEKWVLQEFYRMPKRRRVKQKQPLRDWSFHLSALGLPPDHGKVPCFKRTKPCSWLSSEDFRLMGLARWILLFLEELLIGPLALSTKIQGDLESELTHGNPQE